jgi:hypothetical protein
MGSPGDSPSSVTVCSSCRRKFVVCPFVYEETNRSYLFANGLTGMHGINKLDGLAHLWSISDHEANVPDHDTTIPEHEHNPTTPDHDTTIPHNDNAKPDHNTTTQPSWYHYTGPWYLFPTRLLTSEDEYKWYWHQMIYFPETINTISTMNTMSPTHSLVSSYAMHINLLCACWHLEAMKGSSSLISCRLLILSRLPSSFVWAQLTLLVPTLGIWPPFSQDGVPIHWVRAHSLTGIRNNTTIQGLCTQVGPGCTVQFFLQMQFPIQTGFRRQVVYRKVGSVQTGRQCADM